MPCGMHVCLNFRKIVLVLHFVPCWWLNAQNINRPLINRASAHNSYLLMQSLNQTCTDVRRILFPIMKYLLKGQDKWRKGFSCLHIHICTNNLTFPFLSAPQFEKGCPHWQRTIAPTAICINMWHFGSIKKWNVNSPIFSPQRVLPTWG